MVLGGAAAGRYEIKSCGKAHPWCSICRPEQAVAQRKRKPKPRVAFVRPCRNCGSCNSCLGMDAPEGLKVCRECRQTLPIEQFAARGDTGGRRNQCTPCRVAKAERASCEGCKATFWRTDEYPTLCPKCRPREPKTCAACGGQFVRSAQLRQHCSKACQEGALAARILAARRRRRAEALAAYSTTPDPSCSCCGVTGSAFLAIDHINGGGGKHRRETGGGGFYIWLRRNGYPDGFRILCHNCNFARQLNGGTCPHQEE